METWWRRSGHMVWAPDMASHSLSSPITVPRWSSSYTAVFLPPSNTGADNGIVLSAIGVSCAHFSGLKLWAPWVDILCPKVIPLSHFVPFGKSYFLILYL